MNRGNIITVDQVTIDNVDNIINGIKKARHEVLKYHYPGEEIKVAIPAYFLRAIAMRMRYTGNASVQHRKGELKLFSCEVVDNYQNNIVVYHENMLPFKDRGEPQIIEIKSSN